MNIVINRMRYFVCVARHRSFTKAAAALYLSTPALTQQVTALEKEIGCTLLTRTHRGVALTEEGTYFLARAEKLLAGLDDAVEQTRRIAARRENTLRVGLFREIMGMRTAELLSAFHREQPEARIETQALTAFPGSPEEAGLPDLIVLGESSRMAEAGFAFLPLGESRPCCEVPRAAMDSLQGRVQPDGTLPLEALRGRPLSLLEPGYVNGSDALRALIGQTQPQTRIASSSFAPHSVTDAILDGSILLGWAECTRSGGEVAMFTLDCPLTARYGVYYNPDTQRAVVHAFVRFAQQAGCRD